ncbi:MAG TPA: AAA family ATPase [Candidatus Korarchaeota archaeon]|nr:AAA family ATPase [Candidatus Korarchaeota archaeon]
MAGTSIDESAYLRWLLKYNPFIHLSSESLKSVENFHVWTETDKIFWNAVRDFLENKKKNLVFLVGEFGSGKTHRLRLLYETLEEVPCIYIKVDSQDSRDVIKGIEAALHSLEIIPARHLKKVILSLAGRKSDGYVADPEEAAKEAASVMNNRGEAILLMDEIENVILNNTEEDTKAFTKYLTSLFNALSDGKMIIMACIPRAYEAIKHMLWGFNPPPTVIKVKSMTDEEAKELINRRLKLVFDLKERGSIFGNYFISEETIVELNKLSEGNPRKLMQIFRNILLTAPSLDDKEIRKTIKILSGTKKDLKQEKKEISKYEEYLKRIRMKIGERKFFSLVEAAEATALSLADAKSVLSELKARDLITKKGVRYYFTESALKLVEMTS